MKKNLIILAAICSALSAQAAVYQYSAVLAPEASGATGTGFATADYDDVARTLRLEASFSGLSGNTTASHIHGPTAVAGTGNAGVATTTPTFAGFPLGVKNGSYLTTLDLTLASSYNPTFVTANGGTTASAEAALMAAIGGGRAYLNIHSTTFAGGEIRGYFALVPEPSSFAILGLGAAALTLFRRRKAA